MPYRLYCFVNNLYMSPIQLGIQSAHGVSTLMAQAARALGSDDPARSQQARSAMEWAESGPTMILCKGGNVAGLLGLEQRLGELCGALGLPFAAFREDQDSLGGVITCVCALAPEAYFCLAPVRLDDGRTVFLPPEVCEADLSELDGGTPVTELSNAPLHEFLSIIKTARLA